MKILIFILCFFSARICFAFPIYDDTTLLVKPAFKPGETKTYLVTEEMKSGEFFPLKSFNQFRISFTVLDTADGFTIAYSVKLLKTENKRLILSSVVAKMSDSIQFIYKINKDGHVTRLVNNLEVQMKLILSLDRLVKLEEYDEKEMAQIYHLLLALIKKDGVQICLTPLMLFNNLFNLPAFRKSKDFTAGYSYNILNESEMPGVLITQLKSFRRNDNYVKLKLDFKGNRDSSAKRWTPAFQEIYTALRGKPFKESDLPDEMRNDFEREYEIILGGGWPQKIYNKSIQFYLDKLTTTTTMVLVEEKN